jgi:hypothetical protein
MSLTRLICVIVITGISVWVAGVLLQSKPSHRTAVQIGMILAALLIIIFGFLHGVHLRQR